MRAAVVVVAAALLAVAAARCPNSCSGHGDCGGSDLCTCWPNWQGYDCSERTCEFDVAWAVDHRQNPHYYAECSGKGVCDRSTGLCACFDGYTGSACRRSACPNDCSGHGKCRLVAELDQANKALSTSQSVSGTPISVGSTHQYTEWDGDKIQACVCDGGFFGPDCSQRSCPMGDDPLTICSETVYSGAGSTQNVQIQTLTLSTVYPTGASGAYGTSGSLATDFVGELVLHFTDSYGEVWTTGRIGDASSLTTDLFGLNAANSGAAIRSALKALPNFRIPDVAVSSRVDSGPTVVGSNSVTKAAWAITFNNERNSGNQNLLACDPLPLGCQSAGCSPKYQQPKTWPVAYQNNGYATAATGTPFVAGAAPTYTQLHAGRTFLTSHILIDYATGATLAALTHTDEGSSPIARSTIPAYWSQSADANFVSDNYANTLITADSILDNSAAPIGLGATDQATVQIAVYKKYYGATATNWGYRKTEAYAVYTVNWDTTVPGVAGGSDESCDSLTTSSTCNFHFVPTGLYYDGGTAAPATSDDTSVLIPGAETGVGYNHVPIGKGLYVNLGSPTAFLDDQTQAEALYITFDVATLRCDVQETQRADVDYENLECSGRGVCDHSTGTCACFEGHYGDHCALQTILV